MPHVPVQSGNSCEGMFRLLVRATDPDPTDGRIVKLGGSTWTLFGYERVPDAAEAPVYTCISYAWGRSRITNPFDPGQSISGRALAVIEATIDSLQPPALWIDSLCVPAAGPARAGCLQSMGAIFGAATQVAVVLSKSCSAALEQIQASGRMDPAALSVFENDDWVTRAWTYQEIANSRAVQFISEDGSSAVDGEQLFNLLGQAIADSKKTEGIEAFEFSRRYPQVDELENTLADYMISSPLQRFAFQVMTAMNRRYSERAEDYFNAMIGAITATPVESVPGLQLPAVERFMRACEAKGDYSFIYCVAPRSTAPGRGWRPLAGHIPAVLSWHTYGDGQSGELFPTHLQLNNMCRMIPGTLDADAAELVQWWLQAGGISAPSNDIAAAVLQRLRMIGFSGCGEHLEMVSGYFFPQSPLANSISSQVVVPAGVRWVRAGPGLLVTPDDANIHRFRDVGVFVGRVPQAGNPLSVA